MEVVWKYRNPTKVLPGKIPDGKTPDGKSPDGKNPQLVYAEDGRHIYGGHISPDGKYVLFTGNPQEDGDPSNGGAPMALMRLADAPLIGGDATALRKVHPTAKSGPILTLPAGWEPCWTASEAPAKK